MLVAPDNRETARIPAITAITPQMPYGRSGVRAYSGIANKGPKMRAKLPTPCATPIVAPCSSSGVKLESKPKIGGRVICEERDLLYEEAPAAYKNIESVIGDLVDAGLVSVIATLRPLLTYKTRKQSR